MIVVVVVEGDLADVSVVVVVVGVGSPPPTPPRCDMSVGFSMDGRWWCLADPLGEVLLHMDEEDTTGCWDVEEETPAPPLESSLILLLISEGRLRLVLEAAPPLLVGGGGDGI